MTQRICYDEWTLESNAGFGWGVETTEVSYWGKIERSREYRENCPGLELRWKKRLIRLDTETAKARRQRLAQMKKDLAYHWEAKAARKAKRVKAEAERLAQNRVARSLRRNYKEAYCFGGMHVAGLN